MCSWEALLNFKNEQYVVFLSLIWTGPSLLYHLTFMEFSAIMEFLSTGDKPFSLRPIYVLPHLSEGSIRCCQHCILDLYHSLPSIEHIVVILKSILSIINNSI